MTLRRSASRSGLPPVIALTSTVSPVVKSKMRVPGVLRIGSPSCWTEGAPSSRVQLAMKLSGDGRRPVEARPDRRQRTEIGHLLDRRIAVEREVAERAEIAVAARHRQVDIDRCRRLRLRSSEVDVVMSSRRRLLSRSSVLALTCKVALASPAGSLNKGPLAVASTSPEWWSIARGRRPDRRSAHPDRFR